MKVFGNCRSETDLNAVAYCNSGGLTGDADNAGGFYSVRQERGFYSR